MTQATRRTNFVGAGPSGLSAAIRLKQLAAAQEREVSVCVLEKGSEIGAHILSGAVLDPRALNELVPEWQSQGAPLETLVSEDRFLFLGENRAFRLPNALLPACLHNEGNYVLLHFSAEDPDAVRELERRLRVSDLVLKFITVRIDQKMKK